MSGNGGGELEPAPPMACVSAGEAHALAATRGGVAYSWGKGLTGALGTGDCRDSDLPRRVKSLLGVVVAVAAGGAHSLAIVEEPGGERNVFAWGSANRGQVPWRNVEQSSSAAATNSSSSPQQQQQQQQQQQHPVCFLLPQRVDLPLAPVPIDKTSAPAPSINSQRSMGGEGGGAAASSSTAAATAAAAAAAAALSAAQLSIPVSPPLHPISSPSNPPRAALPYPRAISAGTFHSAVLSSNDKLYVWGCGGAGELGISSRSLPQALKFNANARAAAIALREGREEGSRISRVFSAFVGLREGGSGGGGGGITPGGARTPSYSATPLGPMRSVSFSSSSPPTPLPPARPSIISASSLLSGIFPSVRSLDSTPTPRNSTESGTSNSNSSSSNGGRGWNGAAATLTPTTLAEDGGGYSDDGTTGSSSGEEGEGRRGEKVSGGGSVLREGSNSSTGSVSGGALVANADHPTMNAAGLSLSHHPQGIMAHHPQGILPFAAVNCTASSSTSPSSSLSVQNRRPPPPPPPPPMSSPRGGAPLARPWHETVDLRPRSLLPGRRMRLNKEGGEGEEEEEREGVLLLSPSLPHTKQIQPSSSSPSFAGAGALTEGGGQEAAWGGGYELPPPPPPPPLPSSPSSSKNGGTALQGTLGLGALPVLSLANRSVRVIACGNGFTLASVATTWMSDSEARACVRCQQPFTFSRRRHHCRRCGGVFCAACSPDKLPLLSLGHISAVRVCMACFERETAQTA